MVAHVFDCEEDIWEDRDEGRLIDIDEIAARECESCSWEHELWAKIIEATAITDKEGNVIAEGSARWGEIAFEMLELDEYIEVFQIPPSRISAAEWEFLRAVRHERSRRQAYHSWKANQESKEQRAKS